MDGVKIPRPAETPRPAPKEMQDRIKQMQEKIRQRRESAAAAGGRGTPTGGRFGFGSARSSPSPTAGGRPGGSARPAGGTRATNVEKTERELSEREKDALEREEQYQKKEAELKAAKAKAERRAREAAMDKKRDKFSKFKAQIEKDFDQEELERIRVAQREKAAKEEAEEAQRRRNAHKALQEEVARKEREAAQLRYARFQEDWEALKGAKAGTLAIRDFTQWADVKHGNPSFLDRLDDDQVRKKKMREATLRWHPDKFHATFGPLIDPAHLSRITELVKKVAADLNDQRKRHK